jgi:hypothetical protein
VFLSFPRYLREHMDLAFTAAEASATGTRPFLAMDVSASCNTGLLLTQHDRSPYSSCGLRWFKIGARANKVTIVQASCMTV